MDFLELAKARYSVRSFRPDPVPQEKIDRIIAAGIAAPTACNNQPQRILVIDSAPALERLRRCTHCHYDAPLAFFVCCDTTRCWTRSFDGKTSADVDASIVATHMMLEAAELGLGSTWVMFFIPEAVRTEFELPETLEPVALLVMGTPAEDAKPAPMHLDRRSPEEIVFRRP